MSTKKAATEFISQSFSQVAELVGTENFYIDFTISCYEDITKEDEDGEEYQCSEEVMKDYQLPFYYGMFGFNYSMGCKISELRNIKNHIPELKNISVYTGNRENNKTQTFSCKWDKKEQRLDLTEIVEDAPIPANPWDAAPNTEVNNIPETQEWLRNPKYQLGNASVPTSTKTEIVNRQVKHVIQNAPYYLGDNLIINSCNSSHTGEFTILRVEVLVTMNQCKNLVRYIDLIVKTNKNEFVGFGEISDKTTDFSISVNICKTFTALEYIKEAN